MRTVVITLLLSLLTYCSEAPQSTPAPSASNTDDNSAGAQPVSPIPAIPAISNAASAWDLGFMAAVANPYATDAAAEMLAQGGHAVDAAIAAHAVLGLVEPESSGLGGGGFMVVFEQDNKRVRFILSYRFVQSHQ